MVNSIDPGWVATDMGGRGGRPVAEGCRGIVWLLPCQIMALVGDSFMTENMNIGNDSNEK